LVLASEVLKYPVVPGVVVGVWDRVVVVGEDRVGVRSLWVALGRVSRLLLKAQHTSTSHGTHISDNAHRYYIDPERSLDEVLINFLDESEINRYSNKFITRRFTHMTSSDL